MIGFEVGVNNYLKVFAIASIRERFAEFLFMYVFNFLRSHILVRELSVHILVLLTMFV